jgi:hypothetical protein
VEGHGDWQLRVWEWDYSGSRTVLRGPKAFHEQEQKSSRVSLGSSGKFAVVINNYIAKVISGHVTMMSFCIVSPKKSSFYEMLMENFMVHIQYDTKHPARENLLYQTSYTNCKEDDEDLDAKVESAHEELDAIVRDYGWCRVGTLDHSVLKTCGAPGGNSGAPPAPSAVQYEYEDPLPVRAYQGEHSASTSQGAGSASTSQGAGSASTSQGAGSASTSQGVGSASTSQGAGSASTSQGAGSASSPMIVD